MKPMSRSRASSADASSCSRLYPHAFNKCGFKWCGIGWVEEGRLMKLREPRPPQGRAIGALVEGHPTHGPEAAPQQLEPQRVRGVDVRRGRRRRAWGAPRAWCQAGEAHALQRAVRRREPRAALGLRLRALLHHTPQDLRVHVLRNSVSDFIVS